VAVKSFLLNPEKMQTTVLLVLAVTCYVHASVTIATAYVSGQGAWSVQVGKEDLQNGVAVASKRSYTRI
jgi:hypothetical protein